MSFRGSFGESQKPVVIVLHNDVAQGFGKQAGVVCLTGAVKLLMAPQFIG